jgi:hypothetical protein
MIVMPQLSVRRGDPCPQHFSGGNLFPVQRKTSLPCSGLTEGGPMALYRFQTIRLLKCERGSRIRRGWGHGEGALETEVLPMVLILS